MRYKLIAGGLGLVGYGALWGWAITGDALEAKMKSNQLLLGDIIDRKTRELEAAKVLLAEYAAGGEDAEDDIPEESESELVDQTPEEFREEIVGETPEETESNLRTLIGGYTANPEDVEAFVEMGGMVLDEGVNNLAPFVISRETYSWDEEGEGYAKILHTYYPKYRMLLDDGDELVDNKTIDYIVGWANLDRFGDESGDPDTVFIRNRRLEVDFEIMREEDDEPPAHAQLDMGKAEYETNKAAGNIKFRDGDE